MASRNDSLVKSTYRSLEQLQLEIDPPKTERDVLSSYPDDPCGFAADVLGVELWSRQKEVVAAPVEHKRVSVVSGHKVGKTTSLAIIALWFYCSFPGARVVISAPTDRQVNALIWREIKRLVRHAKVKIPGHLAERAQTGLKDPVDFSEVVGYTARDVEGMAGTSGAYILYLIDEASGVQQEIFDVIEGNRAAGSAWVLLISNPTKAHGEFYDSFHKKKHLYHNIHIDSRESPFITGEWTDRPNPGLASQEWVDEKIKEKGEDDPWFLVRVAGSFVVAEDAKIFPIGLITDSQAAWADVEPRGRLYIGVDPAGQGESGDISSWAPRRGLKIFEIRTKRTATIADHIATCEDMINTYGSEGQPVLCVDSEGETSYKVYVRLKSYGEETGIWRVVRMRGSDKAKRKPMLYDRHRDELAGILREWLRSGGGLPLNDDLEEELRFLEYEESLKGLLKLTPKKKIREELGRSPDRADSVMFACWEPRSVRDGDETSGAAVKKRGGGDIDSMRGGYTDPYAGMNSWRT